MFQTQIQSYSMKRIFPLLTLFFIVQSALGQTFELTSQGFISKSDQKNYIVIDVPGKTQSELYTNVLTAISSMYKDPKKVLSVVKNESITLNGYTKNGLTIKEKLNPIQIGKSTMKYDISENITILFKDGKMRFNSPSFEVRRWFEGGYNSGWATYWYHLRLNADGKNKHAIYNKKGEVNYPDAVSGLNNHFNGLIQTIIEKSNQIDQR